MEKIQQSAIFDDLTYLHIVRALSELCSARKSPSPYHLIVTELAKPLRRDTVGRYPRVLVFPYMCFLETWRAHTVHFSYASSGVCHDPKHFDLALYGLVHRPRRRAFRRVNNVFSTREARFAWWDFRGAQQKLVLFQCQGSSPSHQGLLFFRSISFGCASSKPFVPSTTKYLCSFFLGISEYPVTVPTNI